MQTIDTSDERMRIIEVVLIVAAELSPERVEVRFRYVLQHVFAVLGVVEQGA
jgi:hypothetical protein